MMPSPRDHLGKLGVVAHREVADPQVPTLSGSTSKIAEIRKPWSAKTPLLAIACPRLPEPNSAMLCWPDVRRIFRIWAIRMSMS